MIEKRQIKKALDDKDGKTLVIVNITYPCYIAGEGGETENTFVKRFNAHFEKLAQAFCTFAETKQKSAAAAFCAGEGARPFGCVMNCIVSFEDETLVSVTVDVTVHSGNKTEKKRLAQNWDKKSGVLCSFYDLFGKTEKKYIIKALCEDVEKRMERKVDMFYSDYKKRIEKYFNKNSFCVTPSGYGFIFPSGALNEKNSPVTLVLKKELFSPEKANRI